MTPIAAMTGRSFPSWPKYALRYIFGAIWLGILGRFLRGRLLVKAAIISVAFLGLLDILVAHFFLTR